MSDDLVGDAEYQAMMQGFARNFWQERVPAFCQLLALPASAELKRAVHGLAGTAEMIGEPDIGALAREAEQRWDQAGTVSHEVEQALAVLHQRVLERARQQAAATG